MAPKKAIRRPSWLGDTPEPIIVPKENPADPRVQQIRALELSGPIIQIRVGEEGHQENFFVHQSILTTHSEFFVRATNGKWAESDERLVTLPDDRPEIFRLYVNILYTTEVATKGHEEWESLCRLYILAEKLQDVVTKNRLTDAICWFLTSEAAPIRKDTGGNLIYPRYQPSAQSIEELYARTPEASPLRRLVIDYYTENANHTWLEEGRAVLPADFLCDLAVVVLRKSAPVNCAQPMREGFSHYHESRGIA